MGLALKSYGDVGAEHLHNQKNRGKYTQKIYTVVVHKIQSECIFLQSVTINMGDVSAEVETMIQENSFPCLFFRNSKSFSTIVVTLSKILFKKSSLGLLNPVTSVN